MTFFLKTLDKVRLTRRLNSQGYLPNIYIEIVLAEDGNIVVNCGAGVGPTHAHSDIVNGAAGGRVPPSPVQG